MIYFNLIFYIVILINLVDICLWKCMWYFQLCMCLGRTVFHCMCLLFGISDCTVVFILLTNDMPFYILPLFYNISIWKSISLKFWIFSHDDTRMKLMVVLVTLTDSARSKVSEKEIVDALADHAQQIAQNVLSRSASGKDLEEDVRVSKVPLWCQSQLVLCCQLEILIGVDVSHWWQYVWYIQYSCSINEDWLTLCQHRSRVVNISSVSRRLTSCQFPAGRHFVIYVDLGPSCTKISKFKLKIKLPFTPMFMWCWQYVNYWLKWTNLQLRPVSWCVSHQMDILGVKIMNVCFKLSEGNRYYFNNYYSFYYL